MCTPRFDQVQAVRTGDVLDVMLGADDDPGTLMTTLDDRLDPIGWINKDVYAGRSKRYNSMACRPRADASDVKLLTTISLTLQNN